MHIKNILFICMVGCLLLGNRNIRAQNTDTDTVKKALSTRAGGYFRPRSDSMFFLKITSTGDMEFVRIFENGSDPMFFRIRPVSIVKADEKNLIIRVHIDGIGDESFEFRFKNYKEYKEDRNGPIEIFPVGSEKSYTMFHAAETLLGIASNGNPKKMQTLRSVNAYGW